MKNKIDTVTERFSQKLRRTPEKIIAPVLATILGLIALSVLTSLVPTLIGLLSSTLASVVSILITGVFVYVLLDKKSRSACYGVFERWIKSLTHRFVEINPVDILRDHLQYLHQQLMDMTRQISALSKQMSVLKNQIADNEEKIADLTHEIQANPNMPKERKELKARSMGRIAQSNETLKELLNKMEIMYKTLLEMYKTTELSLEDTKCQIEEKDIEYAAIKSSYDAMGSASEIILGKSQRRKDFDQAVEALANDVANKVGSMERIMEESARVISAVDLQSAVQTEQGMQLLDQFVNNHQQPHNQAEQRFDLHNRKPPELLLAETPVEKSGNHYDAIFNGK